MADVAYVTKQVLLFFGLIPYSSVFKTFSNLKNHILRFGSLFIRNLKNAIFEFLLSLSPRTHNKGNLRFKQFHRIQLGF